jgi:hypothetical protein
MTIEPVRTPRTYESTFRFMCPNNPNVRRKTARRLRELLTRYEFAGSCLDKIRFPSPANGIDEMLVLLLRPLPGLGEGCPS